MRRRSERDQEPGPYFASKELAARWCCSRSSVHSIARSAGLTRVHLGSGKNRIVRYIREEVIAYQECRQVKA